MVHENEIREQLAHYLAGEVSLAKFERWLNNSSVPLAVSDNEAFRLLARLNLIISERHDHVISDAEFREQLVPYVNNIRVSAPVDLLSYRPAGRFVASSVNRVLAVPLPVVA